MTSCSCCKWQSTKRHQSHPYYFLPWTQFATCLFFLISFTCNAGYRHGQLHFRFASLSFPVSHPSAHLKSIIRKKEVFRRNWRTENCALGEPSMVLDMWMALPGSNIVTATVHNKINNYKPAFSCTCSALLTACLIKYKAWNKSEHCKINQV